MPTPQEVVPGMPTQKDVIPQMPTPQDAIQECQHHRMLSRNANTTGCYPGMPTPQDAIQECQHHRMLSRNANTTGYCSKMAPQDVDPGMHRMTFVFSLFFWPDAVFCHGNSSDFKPVQCFLDLQELDNIKGNCWMPSFFQLFTMSSLGVTMATGFTTDCSTYHQTASSCQQHS